MKNRLSIEIDTEQSTVVKFSKTLTDDSKRPETKEEEKKMVDTDIITLTAGLVELIKYSSSAGLGIKEEYKEFVIKSLNDLE